MNTISLEKKKEIFRLRLEHKLTFTDIARQLGVGRDTVSNYCKGVSVIAKQTQWTDKEIDILEKFYGQHGAKYCSTLLGRTQQRVRYKANELGVVFQHKKIIKRVSNTVVISICVKHGEVPHSYYEKKIMGCKYCKREYKRVWRKQKRKNDPIFRYKENLRCQMSFAFKRISELGQKRSYGCFRYLDYTPHRLFYHLDKIKMTQNNKCPMCDSSYNDVILSIDHIIPLSTAKTKSEIITLFTLSNLSLLCKRCNSKKSNRLNLGGYHGN